MTDSPPPDSLLGDSLAAVAASPGTTPEMRFEAAAWTALLRQHGVSLLARATAPAHLTASAVVLDTGGTRTLLVLHGRSGVWLQPGGHLEPGDRTVLDAARREVLEETGLVAAPGPERAPLVLSRHRAPCRPGEVDWHLDVQYLLQAPADEPVVSEESHDVAWFDLEALPEPLAPGVREALATAQLALAQRAVLTPP